MIIILKIILLFLATVFFLVARILHKDFKTTKESEQFEDAPVIDKIKVSFVFYLTMMAFFSIMAVLIYYIIVLPMSLP
jgi:NADH:ubiquinone oxidoreductase subunit 3 (subunit A)